MNIGQLIMHLILNSTKTNIEIATIVKEKFDSKTSEACVAWYKTKLRKEGKLEGRKQRNHVVLSEDELKSMCE